MIDETKIMQYADGTLPQEEHEEVKKAIEADPKLKELYNNFKETGDLLFKLGNEIKSQPLPKNLQEKAEILKSWKKPIKHESGSFNFFGLFKMQYAGIAAAFCLFFVGGFYTNTYIASLDENKTKPVQMAKEKVEVPKKLKMRSLQSEEEDLSTRIENLYLYFDQKKFLNEISEVIDELKINDVFESSLKDNDGKVVKFVLVENFNSNNNTCKKVSFNEPLRLSNIDEGTDVTLDLCKINENYELSSINISK
jgi:membrane-associated HD superfamily phosphohydrolase